MIHPSRISVIHKLAVAPVFRLSDKRLIRRLYHRATITYNSDLTVVEAATIRILKNKYLKK